MTNGMIVQLAAVLLSCASGQVVPIDPRAETGEPRDPSGPVVFVEQTTIDLGDVREGTQATATFKVSNRGAANLEIKDVRTSCGCTTVALTDEERIVKPNETRAIVAKFDTTARIGQQRKGVMLTVNDPAEPEVTLAFVANVVSLFKVLPAQLIHLRSVVRGSELEPIDVFPMDAGAVFDELTLEVPNGLLNYRQEPIADEANGKGVRFVCSVPEEIELGTVAGIVTLRGKIGAESAEMNIRVAGQVVGDLVARPVSLQTLTPVARGHRFNALTVAATGGRPFKLLSADAGPFLDVTFEPIKQNETEYAVRTSISEDAPDGPLAMTLIIRTDNTGQPVLRVPVFVNVRPRYQAEPEIVLLGPRAGRIRKVLIRAAGESALDIRSVSCDHPLIACEVVTAGAREAANLRFVRVGVRADAQPTEDFTAEVIVETNIPGAERVRIPVEYHVGG